MFFFKQLHVILISKYWLFNCNFKKAHKKNISEIGTINIETFKTVIFNDVCSIKKINISEILTILMQQHLNITSYSQNQK